MSTERHDDRPALIRDHSFWGLNLTQFLGAFNDNLFKQLVMLLCLDQVRQGGRDQQGIGLALFSIPFILISGYAGFLSDRYSKRSIIVLCKVAEVVIVLLGMVGFVLNSLPFLLAVLCLMGIHSAFFGPSKYGILPEMLRSEDLPRANGMILMATFLAIIFGLSAAGFAKQKFESTLWLASLPCLVIAVLGLTTSLFIRQTPVAQPGLTFEVSSLLLSPDTRQMLRTNRPLLGVLLMLSVFWFAGGTVYPAAINALCKRQYHFGDLDTGLLAASTGLGIAVGCVAAGVLSKDRVRAWIVRLGAWGLTCSLILLALPGPGWNAVRDEIRTLNQQHQKKADDKAAKTASDDQSAETGSTETATGTGEPRGSRSQIGGQGFYRGTFLGPYGSAVALIAVGLFAGFYSVPLQVYLQSNSSTEQKGRIIGALNLFNWVGIAGAAFAYDRVSVILVDWLELPHAMMFGFAAAVMLPVAIFYRPPDSSRVSA